MAGEVFVNEERLGLFILPCKQSDQLVRIPKGGPLLSWGVRLVPIDWYVGPGKGRPA